MARALVAVLRSVVPARCCLNGKEIRSCVTPVAAVAGQSITTLEGLPALWAAQSGGTSAAAPALHPLQQAWIDVQVPHCGYCQNGMMIQAADLLGDDEESVRGPDPHGDERASLPLWDLSENPDRDPEGRSRDGKGRCVMTGLLHEKEFSRKIVRQGRRRAHRRLQRSLGARAAGKADQTKPPAVDHRLQAPSTSGGERLPAGPERRSTRGSRSTPTTRRRSPTARRSSVTARRPAS